MKLLLVDGMALLYRAFYALIRRPLRDAEGRNTSAIFGFAQVMLSLLEKEKPTHWAVAFDTAVPTFRHDAFVEYKSHRPPMPEEMVPQIAGVKTLLGAMRVPALERDGFEADDLMAALARRAAEQGFDVRLFSSDKDLLQVVGDRIQALVPQGQGIEARVLGPEQVQELWGVGPEHIIDVLALMGDAVDNVPGVRGIGEKTAVKLMSEYGSLEALYARLEEVTPPSVREKLRAGRESAFTSRMLVTLDLDCYPDCDPESLRVAGFDVPQLVELCRGWQFRRLELRFREADPAGMGYPEATAAAPASEATGAAEEGAAPEGTMPEEATTEGATPSGEAAEASGRAEQRPAAPAPPSRELVLARVETAPEAERVFEDWTAIACAAFDWIGAGGGALGSEPEWMLLADGSGRAAAVHWARVSDDGAVRRAAARFFAEGPSLVLADAKAAAHALRRADLPGPRVEEDLGIAAHLLEIDPAYRSELLGEDPPAAAAAASALALDLGDQAVPVERLVRALGGRVHAVRALHAPIEERGLAHLYRRLELPLSLLLADMEEVGVRVDPGVLRGLSRRYTLELRQIEAEIHRLAGVEFNILSSRQLAHVLFEKHNLPSGRRTKTGFSTDSGVLEELALTYELPGLVLQYRQLSKLLSTYVDALPAMLDPSTGRIHARFHQTVVPSGRLSSSDPNMQNIPIRTAQGKEIRRAFVPEPGWKLISADYSQIELRFMAHFSGEPAFLEAFSRGEDIHARTAAEVFGVSPAEVTPEQRGRAKTINFGLMYGMGAMTLAKRLRISTQEAGAFIERYFARLPKVREFRDRLMREARERGYVTTLMGRRVSLPQLRSGDRRMAAQAERVAMNAPLQGSAADLIKQAMLDLDRALRERGLPARLLIQVHDELVLESEASAAEEVAALAGRSMEEAAKLSVPLAASVGMGENWFEIH